MEPCDEKKIEIENINCPGQTTNVNAEKYGAMKNVLLKVIPSATPGLTYSEMKKAFFPTCQKNYGQGELNLAGGARQLDLEAKRLIVRTNSKPLTWYKT
ncbi:MAG: hypothetical protein AAF579_01885 [Cyanobacteria bacterium P01_C01_bin.118]